MKQSTKSNDQPPRHSLMPADVPDHMADAWASCISWAVGQPEILSAFREDTGNQWSPGHTGLEQSIDKACGADTAFMETFIRWANENVWGKM